MRTKTLLLAAAVFAAGLATSMAQVYSANIVGYVNVTNVTGGQYSLLANPLSAGTNGANEILPLMLTNPQYDDSIIVLFSGGSYVFYQYDQGTPGWLDANSAPTTTPIIAPGTGFFFQNAGPTTNLTFVGTVTPDPGTTNSTKLTGGQYVLVGSKLPVAGIPTNSGPNQLNVPFGDGLSSILVTFKANTYTFYSYDGGWVDVNDNPGPAPVLNIGQGFFFLNNAGNSFTNWQQSLAPN